MVDVVAVVVVVVVIVGWDMDGTFLFSFRYSSALRNPSVSRQVATTWCSRSFLGAQTKMFLNRFPPSSCSNRVIHSSTAEHGGVDSSRRLLASNLTSASWVDSDCGMYAATGTAAVTSGAATRNGMEKMDG